MTHLVDPFATKGIEYLIVIGFLALLTAFWMLLNRRQPASDRPGPVQRVGDWFHLADDRLYHQGHTWAACEPDGLVKVGLSDFAQKLLGVPDRLHLPEVGVRLEQGAPALQIGIDGHDLPLLSPIDGEVVERNHAALASPGLVNVDPYGQGWLLKVRPTRHRENATALLGGDLARAWMLRAEETLRRHASGELGLVMQDGGVPVSGIARSLSPDEWHEIARDLLLTR